MKKIYLIISLFLFLICSCSTDSLTDTNTSNQSTTVSLSAVLPNGTNTRVTESANATTGLVTSWNSSDKLSVLLNTGNMIEMSKDGTANGFTAAVDEKDKSAFTSGSIIYGVNNNSSDQITTSLLDGKKLNTVVDFTGQNGSLDNISKYDLMYGKGDVSKSITFNHKVCVMRFDLSSTHLSGNITSAAFSFVPSETSTSLFADKETYNFGATSDSTLVNTNYYALTNPSIAVVNNKASIYLVIPMRKAVSGMLNLTLTCTDGSLIKDLTLSKSITITNKDFNPSTVQAKTISSLTNAPAEGEYVFSDGTWGTLSNNSSKTAIGVFFSSRVSDAEKAAGFIHGYALALTDASAAGPTWGPNGQDAGLTKVTTLAGYYNDINAGYYGTFTKKYDKSNNSYPAWKAANNYNVNVSGFKNSGWYLPSIGQWWDVAANLGKVDLTSKQTSTTGDPASVALYSGNTATTNVNNAIKAAPGGTELKNNDDYWSASECYSQNAAVVRFRSEEVHLDRPNKDKKHSSVRAVLAF